MSLHLNDEKCVSVPPQDADNDDNGGFSEVTSSVGSDDISGAWTCEWNLVCSSELELHACDADLQSRWGKPVNPLAFRARLYHFISLYSYDTLIIFAERLIRFASADTTS